MLRLRGLKQAVLTELWSTFRETKLVCKTRPEWSCSGEIVTVRHHGDATSFFAGMCRQPQLADFVFTEERSTRRWKQGIGMRCLDSEWPLH